MTHSNDSQRPHRTRRQFTAAALVLLAGVGLARQVSAAEPDSSGSAASGKIGAASVLSLVIDPRNPTTMYAGTYCSGVLRSLDGGDSWSAVNLDVSGTSSPGPTGTNFVNTLAIDPLTPRTVYAGTYGDGVFRSLDGGDTWQAIGPADAFGLALAIDPTSPSKVYVGTQNGVFRSLNGGGSWQAIGPTNRVVWALAIDPNTPATLYAGTYGGVFQSLNGGGTWREVGLTNSEILALVVSATAPTTVFAGTSVGTFRNSDGGNNWIALNGGLPYISPVYALALDPVSPTTLYAGMWMPENGGVFKSLNGGSDWIAANTGIEGQLVTAVAARPAAQTILYAATHDDGVFRSLDGGGSWQATGLVGEFCGDGLIGCQEECDDRGESATCDANCTSVRCGDGTVNVTAGEQCDDGNLNPVDGCTNDCTVCGDGKITSPEECDDGDTSSSGANCDGQCRQPRIVGTGTPESCTEAAFAAKLAERSVRFNCGPAPVTISLTSEKVITASATIDGGSGVTLSGGGVARVFKVEWTAGLDLRNLTIADGHAEDGGGIFNNGGALALTNCTLSGNSAALCGGGIYNGGTLALTNCTLSGNSAGAGGGICNGGTATVTNSTLSGNSASADPISICWHAGGGGIYNAPGSFPGGGYGGPAVLRLGNTVVANSPSGGDCCGGTTDDSGHNLIEDAAISCYLTHGVNGNIVGVDPLLGRAGLQDNGGPTQTIALLPGSPAIDAGDPDVCANPPVNGVDQRGYARPGSGHTQCSIGAYEADGFSPEPCVGDCDGTGSATVDELVTLVNVALGNAQPSACPHGVPSGADVDIALIIQAVNAALNGCGVSPAEQGCLASGGTVTSAMCCASIGDFPDTCAIGACGCAPAASHAVHVCECAAGSCFDGSGYVRQ